MKDLAQFFKALSDETRLKILALILWQKELCVCDIENILDLTQSKASRHMRYLLNSNILTDKRVGVSVYYSISKDLNRFQVNILNSLSDLFENEEEIALKHVLEDWLKNNTPNTPTPKSCCLS